MITSLSRENRLSNKVMIIRTTKISSQAEGDNIRQKLGGPTDLARSNIGWISPRWRGFSTETLRWEVVSNPRAARARYSSWITHNTSNKVPVAPRLRKKMTSQIASSPHLKDTALLNNSALWINSGRHKVASFLRQDVSTSPWNSQYLCQNSK
jgi:hypothetical protein